MGIIAWLIVGGLAGWIASMIMGKNEQMGLVANIIVGIIGAFIGGLVMNAIGGNGDMTGVNISSILVAVLGSVILLWIIKLIKGKK